MVGTSAVVAWGCVDCPKQEASTCGRTSSEAGQHAQQASSAASIQHIIGSVPLLPATQIAPL